MQRTETDADTRGHVVRRQDALRSHLQGEGTAPRLPRPRSTRGLKRPVWDPPPEARVTGQKARLPSRGGSRPGSEAPFSVPTGHRNLQLIFSLPPLHPGAQQSRGNSELADTTPALLSQEDDSGDTPCFTDITTLPPACPRFPSAFSIKALSSLDSPPCTNTRQAFPRYCIP